MLVPLIKSNLRQTNSLPEKTTQSLSAKNLLNTGKSADIRESPTIKNSLTHLSLQQDLE